MFRLWGKLYRNNKMLCDHVYVSDDASRSRTRKVLDGLTEICHAFDLSVPIWLEGNIADFKRVSRTRFRSDSFIEEIPFDYLEIQVIEED